jgi:hypothetical protein
MGKEEANVLVVGAVGCAVDDGEGAGAALIAGFGVHGGSGDMAYS